MKKLIFAILLIGLVGCSRELARFDKPFIVSSIRYNDVFESCEYTGLPQEGVTAQAARIYPKIYAPCGLYQIGDTIRLDR